MIGLQDLRAAVDNPQIPDSVVLQGVTLGEVRALAATPSGGPHREAIWGPDAYHPGYGKGVCAVDGEPWPCTAATPSGGPLDVDIEQLLTDIGKSDTPDEAERWARRAVALVRARLTEDAG